MSKREIASQRVAVTQSTHQKLRDFSYGLGVTHDQAIRILLECVIQPGEDAFVVGRRLQKQLENNAKHPSSVVTNCAESSASS